MCLYVLSSVLFSINICICHKEDKRIRHKLYNLGCRFCLPCCYVRYDLCIKRMFDSFLPPVVCKGGGGNVLFLLFVFVGA
jgi:hypothetical protein